MARKKRKSKVPTLRKGLTVDNLLEGHWVLSPDRYVGEMEMTNVSEKILRATCQAMIDEADRGEQVTRRAIINTIGRLNDMLITAKDHITGKMGDGRLTPTLLDKIANA